jgi:hypothetical protein
LAKYNSNVQVKEDGIDRVFSTNGERKNAYRILVRKLGGKPLERAIYSGWIILKLILDREG